MKEKLTENAIYSLILAFFIFTEAAWTLLSSFWKGIYKKEVLETKSNLGFDFKIIVRNQK